VAGTPNPLLLAAELLAPTPHPHRSDPVAWVTNTTGECLWSKQQQIARSIERYRKIAVPACHGPGKSFLTRIVAWWIDTHPPGEALAITTAPTASQLKQVFWRELRTAHRKAGLKDRINLNNEWYFGDELVAIGRKPSDHNEHGFQGMCAKYLLIVVDEACGVAGTIWKGSRR